MRRAHCPRCECEVEVDAPWWGLRVIAVLWIVLALAAFVVSPIILAEITCLAPMFCLFLLGGGFLFRESTRIPTCRRCKLDLPPVKPGAREPSG